jgi:hypothetical protein
MNLKVRFAGDSFPSDEQVKLYVLIGEQSLHASPSAEEVMQSALLYPNQLLLEIIALGLVSIR